MIPCRCSFYICHHVLWTTSVGVDAGFSLLSTCMLKVVIFTVFLSYMKWRIFVVYFSKATEIEDVCNSCGFGGHLLCCDSCPLLFHIECVVPPLKKVPRGKWFCPKCKMMKGEKYGVDFVNCQNQKWEGNLLKFIKILVLMKEVYCCIFSFLSVSAGKNKCVLFPLYPSAQNFLYFILFLFFIYFFFIIHIRGRITKEASVHSFSY